MLSIEFDSPDGVYFPGQHVSGHVKTTETLRAGAIYASIHGRAFTNWTETEYFTKDVFDKRFVFCVIRDFI